MTDKNFTDNTPTEDVALEDDNSTSHLGVSTNPFTIANAKKAYSAGVAGAVTAIGGLSIGAIFAGGSLDTDTLLADAGIVLGGFVLGFFGAWLPRQR